MAELPIYLADFSCFNAPEELKVDFYKSQEAAWRWKVNTATAGTVFVANLNTEYAARRAKSPYPKVN
jgi:hypothetical protein